MSISNKINGLLAFAGRNKSDAAQYFGITRQSMSNKFQRGYFSADDLIRFCDLTGAKLFIELPNGERIVLDTSDVEKKKGSDE